MADARKKIICNQICGWNDPSDGCIKPDWGACVMSNAAPQTKTQTNADRIRAMSDEELAWELMTWRCEAVAKHCGVQSVYPNTQKTICEWLKQPADK